MVSELKNRERCILEPVRGKSRATIEKIRAMYDYIYGKVPPHVTLVFPFRNDISNQKILELIRAATEGIPAFEIRLRRFIKLSPQKPGGEWVLALNLGKGQQRLAELNHRINSRIHAEHGGDHKMVIPYRPHITVGRFQGFRGRGN